MGKHKKSRSDGSKEALMVLVVLLAIAIVGVAGYTGKIFVDEHKNDNSAQQSQAPSTTVANTDKKEEDKTKQQIDENKKEETQPKVEEKTNENEEKKPVEETNLSDEDKAISLAKKQYGSEDGVYFRIEQIQSNNIYIVSVRDNETTRDLAWYTIDVNAGTVK